MVRLARDLDLMLVVKQWILMKTLSGIFLVLFMLRRLRRLSVRLLSMLSSWQPNTLVKKYMIL